VRSTHSVAKPKIRKVKYNLITVNGDAKTVKGLAEDYLTAIIYMSPAREADGVHNLCPFATKGPAGCEDACLYHEGRARLFKTVKQARVRRTLFYLRDYDGFCRVVEERDIPRFLKQAAEEGLTPCFRPNGTTDQPKLAHRLAKRYPRVQFYDYTKIPRPWLRTLPNYHLTFSYSGENLEDCREALDHGINVSVVFQRELPETWHGYRVVDGDKSDLRFLDPQGVIVGLKAKGQSKKIEAGGFIQIQPVELNVAA
jgi:hypothetical protein